MMVIHLRVLYNGRKNLISGKSKKKILVSRTCAKAEYKTMEVATGELIWLKQVIGELKIEENI